MARLRFNNQLGIVQDTPLTAAAVTLDSPTLAAFPVITAPDIAVLTLEPDTVNEEIVYVTAHTAGSTAATILPSRAPRRAPLAVRGELARHHDRDGQRR